MKKFAVGILISLLVFLSSGCALLEGTPLQSLFKKRVTDSTTPVQNEKFSQPEEALEEFFRVLAENGGEEAARLLTKEFRESSRYQDFLADVYEVGRLSGEIKILKKKEADGKTKIKVALEGWGRITVDLVREGETYKISWIY
ncbi:hypothetical protein [Calderihabitans maritimus]|uniref:DUF4878 domain-containing protein n=1 Tax=Calderihabitans maritimus TaxID=1246530 RepID=A0A1Z5HQL9_9FIRM|nr:hypothetical protein [Calderihabitans maritimus]GAW91826.1 hypothetical protein KKC1_09860 [Calderihabitans maritimus]